MKQTWRWFGPHDTITTADMRQSGVAGVVSALHHVKPGDIWPVVEIQQRQQAISQFTNGSPSGLTWDVVESLPVSETIKTKGPAYREHIANYIKSLHNLAACGIEVICYNFMPVLDWTRTDLRRPMDHGGTAMCFDLINFAAFDLHILNRKSVIDDYSGMLITQAAEQFQQMTPEDAKALRSNIVAGLPRANDAWTLDEVRANLGTYDAINADQLYANLIDFLSEVAPVAESLGLRLCCHPDAPPLSR